MKGKRITKRVFSGLLMLSMVFSIVATNAFAADTDCERPMVKEEGTNQVTFSQLDKVKVGESIEYEVTDSNGNPAVISIERVDNQDAGKTVLRSATDDPRTWKVSYSNAIINCHFYMTVSKNKVTSVYDEWILTVGYTYSDATLTKTSTYGKLGFTATIYGGFASLSCWLKGTVTGSENDITVSYKF